MRQSTCRDISSRVYDCWIFKRLFLHLLYFLFLYHGSDLALSEENAGQRLLDMENQKKQRALELEHVEEQLRRYNAKNQMIDSELQYPFCLSSDKLVFRLRAPRGRAPANTEHGGTVTKYWQILMHVHVMIPLSRYFWRNFQNTFTW